MVSITCPKLLNLFLVWLFMSQDKQTTLFSRDLRPRILNLSPEARGPQGAESAWAPRTAAKCVTGGRQVALVVLGGKRAEVGKLGLDTQGRGLVTWQVLGTDTSNLSLSYRETGRAGDRPKSCGPVGSTSPVPTCNLPSGLGPHKACKSLQGHWCHPTTREEAWDFGQANQHIPFSWPQGLVQGWPRT